MTAIKTNPIHFEYFKKTVPQVGSWLGSSPESWFSWIENNQEFAAHIPKISHSFSKNKIRRTDLFEMIKNKKIDTLPCCISVLAWGGMNRKHGAQLLSKSKNWVGIAENIREGHFDRHEAYEKFSNLRIKSMLPGMGPAYFTKLIFFLLPPEMQQGYIMDQWTSASVNLLFDSAIIKTQLQKTRLKNGRLRLIEIVSDQNSKENYELFCNAIESIAGHLNFDPSYIEEMMFSEGRGKGQWRNYVVNQRLLSTNRSHPIL